MESPAVLDLDEVVHRVKRFKVSPPLSISATTLMVTFQHQSYAESLKDVHLPSALDLTKFDHDIAVLDHIFS